MAYGNEETGGSAQRLTRSTGPESALVISTRQRGCPNCLGQRGLILPMAASIPFRSGAWQCLVFRAFPIEAGLLDSGVS